MKSCFLLVLIVFLFQSFQSPACSQQSSFEQANDRMDEYRIEEALETYRSIEGQGYQSGKLYFNMAVATVYQDSLGLAKYYLLQSAGFDETRAEAEQALRFVNDQFNRRSAVLPKLPWERFYEWLETAVGASALMLTGIFLLNLGVGGIISSWFTGKASGWLRKSGYAAGACSLLLIASSLYIQHLDHRYDTAVLVENRSTVHEHPASSSAPVSTAYEGYLITVDRKRSEDGWYYIRLENGMYGWIESPGVKTF